MALTLNKLSDVSVKAAKKPGRYSDGGGLYLNVAATGSKSWVFMWKPTDAKSRREMGLGAYPTVGLARARSKAADCRTAVDEGRDPIAEKAKEAEPTFGECADRFIEALSRSGATRNTGTSGLTPWEKTIAPRSATSACRP